MAWLDGVDLVFGVQDEERPWAAAAQPTWPFPSALFKPETAGRGRLRTGTAASKPGPGARSHGIGQASRVFAKTQPRARHRREGKPPHAQSHETWRTGEEDVALGRWTIADCGIDAAVMVFWPDSRSIVQSFTPGRERAVVLIYNYDPESDGMRRGSGVVVAPEWILTAAHVVEDGGADDGSAVPPERIAVCTQGNQRLPGTLCVDGVEQIVVHPQWESTRTLSVGWRNRPHDLALVRVLPQFTWLGGTGAMSASIASAQTHEAHLAHTVGNPGIVLSQSRACTPNEVPWRIAPLFETDEPEFDGEQPLGVATRQDSSARVAVRRGLIETDLDVSDGQSGSPIYYMPDGSRAYLTGVLVAGWTELSAWRTGGPHISSFRDWLNETIRVASR